MGLFGGSSSKSYSTTMQYDQRVIAEEAEILAGAESSVVVSYPQSIAIGPYAKVSDVIVQPFSPEIKKMLGEVIETFAETSEKATEVFAESSERVTGVLGEKLLTTQQGVASILPEMAKYIAIAVVVIIVARGVFK